MKKILGLGLSALLVANACSVLPEPEQVRIYPLNVAALAPTAEVFSGTLRVDEPTALLALDTPRVAVYQEDGRQAYWQGVRLQDRMPVVVQESLLRAIGASGVVRQVVGEASGSHYRVELQTHIEDFGIMLGPEPTVTTVVIRVQLRSAHDREVIASHRFAAQTPVTDASTERRMDALAVSFQRVQEQLVEWLAKTL